MNIERLAVGIKDAHGLDMSDEAVITLLRHALSKLAEQAGEPVAYRRRDGMLSCRLPGGHVVGIDWTPLFTEAQLIAAQQRTAEACEMLCDDIAVTAWGSDNRFRDAIRNGEWRKYL